MSIVAMSSGTLSGTPENGRYNTYLRSLVDAKRPRVCYIPTAVGDAAQDIVAFYRTFDAHAYEPSHLGLFNRQVEDARSFLLGQDIIFVNGGNTASMLAVWRRQGIDAVLREAWEAGIVLCGFSAGALCWFESGTTDSFGPRLAGMTDCLGFLHGSFSPHYAPRRTPPRLPAVCGRRNGRRLGSGRRHSAALRGHRATSRLQRPRRRPRLPCGTGGRRGAGTRGRDRAPTVGRRAGATGRNLRQRLTIDR